MSDQTANTQNTVKPAPAKRASKPNPPKLPPYNVILLNDDDHTYQYVIDMLRSVFGYSTEKGYQLAKTVDTEGRVILLTTTKEHAELKRDQVHAFGPDARIQSCTGSMWATIEPAE
jgi:ATP-dependent Clp protease adaptor protein ClpS